MRIEVFLKIHEGQWQTPIDGFWALTSIPSEPVRELDQLIGFVLATPPEKNFKDDNRKMCTHVRLQLRPQSLRDLPDAEILLRDDRTIELRIKALKETMIESVWIDKAANKWATLQRWLTMQPRGNCDVAPWDIPEIPQWIPYGLKMSRLTNPDQVTESYKKISCVSARDDDEPEMTLSEVQERCDGFKHEKKKFIN